MIGNFFGFKKIAPAATLKPNALPKAKKKGSVKARQLQRLSTLEGMGSCSTLPESVIELETSVPRPDPITLSLETTKKIRAQLTIAKRVAVWFYSDTRAGLRA